MFEIEIRITNSQLYQHSEKKFLESKNSFSWIYIKTWLSLLNIPSTKRFWVKQPRNLSELKKSFFDHIYSRFWI